MLRLSLLLITLLASGCGSTPSVKDSFEEVLRPCADIQDGMIYLGPSNVYGPGSVWRKAGELDYRVRWSLDRADPPSMSRIVTDGTSIRCTGERQTESVVSPRIAVPGTVAGAPIDAELGIDVTRASEAVVSVESLRIDTVDEFEFETWAKGPSAKNYGEDLDQPNRLVMTSAVRVEGYRAEFTFDPKTAIELGAEVGSVVEPVGGPANVTARWTEKNKLTVEAENAFYIAGQLTEVLPGRVFGASESSVELPLLATTPEVLPPYAVASPDETFDPR